MADIYDRQNELMGNLPLHKELDFILAVNEWHNVWSGRASQVDFAKLAIAALHQCIRPRCADQHTLIDEIAAWERERNAAIHQVRLALHHQGRPH